MNQQSSSHDESSIPKKQSMSRSVPPPVPPPPMPIADGAVFRSMSMAVAPPAPRFFSQAPLQKEAKLQFSSTKTASTTASSSSSEPFVWKLESVAPVPFFHPLERTAITIDSVSLETVTSRISTFLKSQSITSSYNDKEGRVDCMTPCLLKFCVQLWQGDKPNITIVEVQRCQGCCIQMQHFRSLLTSAILDQEPVAEAPKPSPKTMQSVERLCPPLPSREECLPSALECCKEMLESERLDCNRLGLESLVTLTDSSKMLSQDAEKACCLVLEDASWQALLGKHFENKQCRKNAEDDAVLDYQHGEFYGSLHLLALRVLAQALESSSVGSIDLESSFWAAALPALYYNVQVASRRPAEAAASMKCLRLLQTLQGLEETLPPASELQQCLGSAKQFGRDHSRSLEHETDQLLGRLQHVL